MKHPVCSAAPFFAQAWLWCYLCRTC